MNGYIISDFNCDTFKGYLENDPGLPMIQLDSAPFNQVTQSILSYSSLKQEYDFLIPWVQPQYFNSFQRCLELEQTDTKDILSEVDSFLQSLLQLHDSSKQSLKYIFIPTWIVPSGYTHQLLYDLVAEMNLRLSQFSKRNKQFHLLNTQLWAEQVGKSTYNEKLWYFSKNPFGNDIYKLAARDLKLSINNLNGLAKKLIILDLDDTLWGGVVGDTGWKNLRLGGHDAVGEAFVDFQKTLKSLKNSGIALAIVSKNEESVAIEAIRQHPEMILGLEDFVGWKINWNDKAQNILDLTTELKLGLQSVLFIDDNVVERNRVREALPEIFVPEWPSDKTKYKRTLLELNCFSINQQTEEDRNRTEMYLAEKKRSELKTTITSIEDWLQTLEMRLTFEELLPTNIPRVVQLFNKTNQMNLSTRRLTEPELLDWLNHKGRKLWAVKVSDKFGDSGLTGIVSVELKNNEAKIVDFILSCRVMGRKIEEAMLHVAINYTMTQGAKKVLAYYEETKKNKPCLEFMKRSRLAFKNDANCFIWDCNKKYPLPNCVKII